MTLTTQAVDDHYNRTIGTVKAYGSKPELYTTITRAYILKRLGSGSQTIELCVIVPTGHVNDVKAAFQAYFKPYLEKGEKLVCYLSSRNQKFNISCKVDETNKLQVKLENTNLEALINKLI